MKSLTSSGSKKDLTGTTSPTPERKGSGSGASPANSSKVLTRTLSQGSKSGAVSPSKNAAVTRTSSISSVKSPTASKPPAVKSTTAAAAKKPASKIAKVVKSEPKRESDTGSEGTENIVDNPDQEPSSETIENGEPEQTEDSDQPETTEDPVEPSESSEQEQIEDTTVEPEKDEN